MTYKITHKITYEEFKREIKKLGLKCTYGKYSVQVYLTEDEVQAIVDKDKQFIATIYLTSSLISDDVKDKLSDLCFKLARTPINERGKWSDV